MISILPVKVQKVIGVVTIVGGLAIAVWTAWKKVKSLKAATTDEEVKESSNA